MAPFYDADGPAFINGTGSDIAEPGRTEICYDRFPRDTLKERFLLTNATGALLPLIRQPMQIMHSRCDNVVDPKDALGISTSVGSSGIRLSWLERSYNVATLDYDRGEIAPRTAAFLA